jgi:hypothetical protein
MGGSAPPNLAPTAAVLTPSFNPTSPPLPAEMPMPECQSTGFTAMCADPDVAANFGLVCSEPPVVPDNC